MLMKVMMLPVRAASRLPMLLAAGAGLACSSGTAPTSTPTVDALLRLMSIPSLAASAASISTTSTAGYGARSPVAAATCTFESATTSYVCPDLTSGGVTTSRRFTMLDGGGNPRARFDGGTDGLRLVTTLSGTVKVESDGEAIVDLVIQRQEEMTLSGVRAGQLVLSGTADGESHGTIGLGAEKSAVTSTEHQVTADVVFPPPSPDTPWPRSGTITNDLTNTATPSGQQSLTTSYRTRIEFDGTSVVTLTITTSGGATTCKVDLSKPSDPPTCN
jgi:hypothetical protein